MFKNCTISLSTAKLGRRWSGAFAGGLLAIFLMLAPPAHADTAQSVVAIVNDQPITNFDIRQRMQLDGILGFASDQNTQARRKEVLQDLVDGLLKRLEASRLGISITTTEVQETLQRMLADSGMSMEGLRRQLDQAGISMSTLTSRIAADMAWNRIISARYNINTNIDDSQIDRRLRSIENDPRRQPRRVYVVQEIRLPVEQQPTREGTNQLLQARLVEAQRIMERYSGCNRAREAASGIFNVQIGEQAQVPRENLPDELRRALEQAGPGRIIGPNRASAGIQLIGFCGIETIRPPEISREQIRNLLLQERVGMYTERYLRDLRRAAFIDYRDASLQPETQ